MTWSYDPKLALSSPGKSVWVFTYPTPFFSVTFRNDSGRVQSALSYQFKQGKKTMYGRLLTLLAALLPPTHNEWKTIFSANMY